MNNQRIWLSLAKMTGREQAFIQEAFDTNWVVPLGPNVDGFERELGDFLGTEHVVALSSGTAALHLGLVMLGVQPGDEVICQSFTFAASVNPVTYLGATPILVGSDPSTWNMDPDLLDQAIADRLQKTGKLPKAIIPVYLYGMPAQIDHIMAVANKYGIPVLEDACEALGSEFQGRKCGTFGTYGALSFNGNKMITTSGGGALICPTAEAASRVKFYATQARDANPLNEYWHTHIGYNYRLSNICAGIGRGQLTAVNDFIARRREIHALYSKALSSVTGIQVQEAPAPEYDSNFWLTTILVNPDQYGCDRNELSRRLNDANIESRPLWKPMHLQPTCANFPFYGNGLSEQRFAQGLCLPSGPCLSNDDVQRVIDVINQPAQ
jgi:dTDP-4-amino-4,6-dideoxygalactose transaminase